MLGQCSPAHTRVQAPYERPKRYAAASTATAMTRRRTFGFCHQEMGPGSVTGGGAGMDAIPLQPSEAARRLPAVVAARTIPRHARPLGRTRVAGLPGPHPQGSWGAPPPRPPPAALRPPPPPPHLPRPGPHAPAAVPALFTCPPPPARA